MNVDELPTQDLIRAIVITTIYEGTSEIQRHIISRALLRPFERRNG